MSFQYVLFQDVSIPYVSIQYSSIQQRPSKLVRELFGLILRTAASNRAAPLEFQPLDLTLHERVEAGSDG